MTTDQKLAAILAAVQTDPGGRGLARVPEDNLFTATAGDFAAACREIGTHPAPVLFAATGFIIPSVDPPTFETDGPLGAVFLARALLPLRVPVLLMGEPPCGVAMAAGIRAAGVPESCILENENAAGAFHGPWVRPPKTAIFPSTHIVAIERPGPAADGRYRTMRGRDITDLMLPGHHLFRRDDGKPLDWRTVGIGDGGNEIGMGRIPHETVVANVPNGDAIHCRVATDFLVVAGVSNWGAYALAAGLFAVRDVGPPDDLFDPARELAILEVMVTAGPLVDGVTGQRTATVDGLTWDEYAKPLAILREILAS